MMSRRRWIGCWAFVLAVGARVLDARVAYESRSQDSPATSSGAGAVVQLLAVGPGTSGKNRACSATGFLVNEEGYIITNGHVVEEAKRCLGPNATGKIVAKFPAPAATTALAISCDVVGVDDLRDLALLKTERPLPPGLGSAQQIPLLLPEFEASEGTLVRVTGHPASAWEPVTQLGRVVRRAQARLSDTQPEETEVLVLDISLRRGSSGSPVYLAEGGGVVGIVEQTYAARPSQTVAVPILYAVELLRRHEVRWYSGSRQQKNERGP